MTDSAPWDQRYREGKDGWELGRPAPPLEQFLRSDPRRPLPPGRVLVTGCGRGQEANLLAELGFETIGLDFSAEAIAHARRWHGADRPQLRWLQADLFDAAALEAAGVATGSLQGLLEHTCFCAIDPAQRAAYLETVVRLLAPGGWLVALFWCHGRPGGPPWGSDATAGTATLDSRPATARLAPAQGSLPERENEWLGLWQRP